MNEQEAEKRCLERLNFDTSLADIQACTYVYSAAFSEEFNEEYCIWRVLRCLPCEVREFVQDHVHFVVANASFPTPLPVLLLMLILVTAPEDTEESYCTMVAHEIGHIWRMRQSDGTIDIDRDGGKEEEIAADDLAVRWGFGRVYENYEKFQ